MMVYDDGMILSQARKKLQKSERQRESKNKKDHVIHSGAQQGTQ
jgi:hypothetical protein